MVFGLSRVLLAFDSGTFYLNHYFSSQNFHRYPTTYIFVFFLLCDKSTT